MRAESKKGWRVAAKYWESEGHKLEAQLASQDALLEEAVELIKAMSPYLVSERDANMGRDEVMGLRSKKRLNEVRAMKDAFLTSRNHPEGETGEEQKQFEYVCVACESGECRYSIQDPEGDNYNDYKNNPPTMCPWGKPTSYDGTAEWKPIRLIEDGNKETCPDEHGHLPIEVEDAMREATGEYLTGKKPEAEARKENSEKPDNLKSETGGAK